MAKIIMISMKRKRVRREWKRRRTKRRRWKRRRRRMSKTLIRTV